MMKRWINFAGDLIERVLPFGSDFRRSLVRRFSNAPAWMPSMFLIPLWASYTVFRPPFALWPHPFGLANCLAWTVITYCIIWQTMFASFRKLKRLGPRSGFRDRIWFEISGLVWHIAPFAVAGMIAGSLLETFLQAKPVTWDLGKTVLPILLSIWAATGTTGYIFAMVRWRIPRGRAFECVNFFLPLTGSIPLLDRSQQAIQPVAAIESGLAIIILSASFVVTVSRCHKFDQQIKNAANELL